MVNQTSFIAAALRIIEMRKLFREKRSAK